MAEDDDYCLPEEDDVWEEQVDSDHNEPMDMEDTQYIHSDGDTDEYATINDRYEDRTESDDSEYEDLEDYEENEMEIAEEMQLQQENPKEVIKTKRGMTRMLKLHRDFANKEKTTKRNIGFDNMFRPIGDHRIEFSSFLGYLARDMIGLKHLCWKEVLKATRENMWDRIQLYFEVPDRHKKEVMKRVPVLLRDFRRKLYKNYVLPFLGKPDKLKTPPKKYRTVIDQESWDRFVKYVVDDPEFKTKSKKGKEAIAQSKFPHRTGRGGYSGLKERLAKEGDVAIGDLDDRCFMWAKARENAAGDIPDQSVKEKAAEVVRKQKLYSPHDFNQSKCARFISEFNTMFEQVEKRKLIQEGTIKVGPYEDALTLVVGPDNGGRIKGVGFGVTAKIYYPNRRKARQSKEIEELREKLAAKDKDLECTKASYQRLTTNLIAQGFDVVKIMGSSTSNSGGELQSEDAGNPSKNNKGPESVKQLPKKHGKSGSQKSSESIIGSGKLDSPCTKTPTVSTESPVSLVSKNKSLSSPSTEESQNTASEKVTTDGIGCRLWSVEKDNIVALGRAYSSKKILYNMKSGMPGEATCYRVRVTEVLDETIKLPFGKPGLRTLKDVGDTEISWLANKTILDQKVSQPKHYEAVKSTAVLNGSPSCIAISEKVPKVTQQNSEKHTLDVTPKATSNPSNSDITRTVAVHQGRRCYLFDPLSKANVLARGRAFRLLEKQQLHGSVGVEVDCHKILIEEVLKENYSLPVRFAGMETLGQTLGKAIPWPKHNVQITEPAKKNLTSNSQPNTSPQKSPARSNPSDGSKKQSPNFMMNSSSYSKPDPSKSKVKAKCDFWSGSRGNVVARGSILPRLPNQKVHGQEVPINCCVVNILEVIDPSFVLTEPSGEFKLLGEAKDGFVAWPINNCSNSDDDKETPQHGKHHEQPEPVLDSEKKLDSAKLNEELPTANPHSGSHASSEKLSQKTSKTQKRLYVANVQQALQLSAAQPRKTRSVALRMSQSDTLNAETPPSKKLKKN